MDAARSENVQHWERRDENLALNARQLQAVNTPQDALSSAETTGDLQLPRAELWCDMNTEERGFEKVLENQEQIEQLQKAVQERGQEWLSTAEEWIKENPYLAMGIAFAAGLTIAALVTKRD